MEHKKYKIKCPFCGHEMSNIQYEKGAVSAKVFTKCKNSKCKKEFEIKLN